MESRVTDRDAPRREKEREREGKMLAIPDFFADYYIRNARFLLERFAMLVVAAEINTTLSKIS